MYSCTRTRTQTTLTTLTANSNSIEIMWLKTAVAVAILQNKPQELSARQYTEKVQSQYQLLQSALREKHDHAKMQIVQVKQTLKLDIETPDKPSQSHTSHLCQNSSLSYELSAVDNTIGAPELDLSRINSQLAEGSKNLYLLQANLKTGADHVANTEVVNNTGGLVETSNVAISSKLSELSVPDDPSDAVMLENCQFMCSMLELQQLGNQESLMEPGLLEAAAVRNIQNLRATMDRDVMVLSERCLVRGAESVVLVMEDLPWLGDRPSVMQEVCLLVECIMGKLVQPSSTGLPQILRQKRALEKMLLIFLKGKMEPLLSSILDSLVESVESFCQELMRSQVQREAVDPDWFDSHYFVIDCLETTTKMWGKDCPLHVSFLQEAQVKIDKAMMDTTHCFPLVSQSLLKVSSLIECILQKR